MLDIIRGSTNKIINLSTLTIKVRKNNDFFLIELSEFLGYHHIRMRIVSIKLYYILISSEITCDSSLQRRACKSSPVHSFSSVYGFVRFIDSSVEIKKPSDFYIRFQLSCKFLSVVVFQLFFYYSDYRRDAIILTFS